LFSYNSIMLLIIRWLGDNSQFMRKRAIKAKNPWMARGLVRIIQTLIICCRRVTVYFHNVATQIKYRWIQTGQLRCSQCTQESRWHTNNWTGPIKQNDDFDPFGCDDLETRHLRLIIKKKTVYSIEIKTRQK